MRKSFIHFSCFFLLYANLLVFISTSSLPVCDHVIKIRKKTFFFVRNDENEEQKSGLSHKKKY